MNQTEASAKARQVVLTNTGVDADPDSVRLIQNAASRRVWRAFTHPSTHFFPEELATGATIDGGEYIIDVDDETGEASVIG